MQEDGTAGRQPVTGASGDEGGLHEQAARRLGTVSVADLIACCGGRDPATVEVLLADGDPGEPLIQLRVAVERMQRRGGPIVLTVPFFG